MQRLMIADSSDIVRTVAKRILSELNFMVIEAASASEAAQRCKAELPAVLVVDAALDGALDLISGVRTMQGGDKVRIYYCVIEADLRKMMQGKRAGADDFLLKPFDRKILSAVFANLSIAA